MNNPTIKIQAIGSFFQNDPEGFVINPASRKNIPEKWHPVIEAVKNHYIKQEKENLHSLYLRGSLVRGQAIDHVSDIDFFAVVKGGNFRWEEIPSANELNKNLVQKYPFVEEIEMMKSSLEDGMEFENPKLPMLIKTHSLCIFGEDLSPAIRNFKPDKSMMLNYRWLAEDFEDFSAKKRWSEEELKEFLKVVIRSGFEVVMEEEGRFTPDLFLCYKSFSKHFPEMEKLMEKALFYYLNPAFFNKQQKARLLVLCAFLIEKVKTRFL